MKKLLLLLCCLFLSNLLMAQGFVTVGTDNNCDYSAASLQEAINNNARVRVTNQTVYQPLEIINHSVELWGGYNNCSDAQNNITSGDRTEISGNNNQTVIQMQTTAVTGHMAIKVVLGNLDIHAGLTSGTNLAGGVNIKGNVNTSISYSLINDNNASVFGGGIYISGLLGAVLDLDSVVLAGNVADSGGALYASNNAVITVKDSFIKQNNAQVGGGFHLVSGSQLLLKNSDTNTNIATSLGAGMYCGTNSSIHVDENSLISDNHSDIAGGGLYANNGCVVTTQAGDNLPEVQSNAGINNNTANSMGGGAYIHNATLHILGNAAHYANVIANHSTVQSNAKGGGIYARGNTARIKVINGRINRNQAKYGSAIYLTEGAQLIMRRSTGQCFGDQLCSEVTNNRATFSGTILTEQCAKANIFQTTFRDNKASLASVLSLNGDQQNNCESVFEGNQVYGNQDTVNESHTLFKLDSQATLNFAFNTVTDNFTENIFLMGSLDNSLQSLHINSSIIWNAPANVVVASSPNHHYSGQCFNVPAPNLMPDSFGPLITSNEPTFADPLNHNYALTLYSAPLDYCDTSAYQPLHHDIMGVPRGFAVIAPVFGHYDMGAFEFNNVNHNDVIFYDHFED